MPCGIKKLKETFDELNKMASLIKDAESNKAKEASEIKAQIESVRQNLEQELGITKIEEFGTNYVEYYHNPQGAIQKLLKEKNGQVVGAFYREELGDIDLVWGDSHKGLKHIVERRTQNFEKQGLSKGQAEQKALDFAKNDLSEIIQNGEATFSKERNRAFLETPEQKAVIALDYRGDEKKWIVTAFNKYNEVSPHPADMHKGEAHGVDFSSSSHAETKGGKDKTFGDTLFTTKQPLENPNEQKLNNTANIDDVLRTIEKSRNKDRNYTPKDTNDNPHGAIYNAIDNTLLEPQRKAIKKAAELLSKLDDKLSRVLKFRILTTTEINKKMNSIQRNYYNTLTDIQAHANSIRDVFDRCAISDDLVRALDGSLEPSKLSKNERDAYDLVRKVIDENARALVEAGLLAKENSIKDYVTRIYAAHQKDQQRAKHFFTKKYGRKNLTYEDRIALNQINEPGLVIPATIYKQKKQLALGQFFESVCEEFGYKKDSEGNITKLNGEKVPPNTELVMIENIDVGGGVKKFGKLSGVYVEPEVKRMLYEMNEMTEYTNTLSLLAHTLTKVVEHIKINMTAKNPFTHFYNIASNISLGYLNGDLGALKDVLTLRAKDRQAFNDLVRRADAQGLNSMLFDIEGRGDVLIESDKPTSAIGSLIWRVWGEMYLTKDSTLGGFARKSYDWEDKIFKLANFYKRIQDGEDDISAFRKASELYVDYALPLPNSWKFLDKTGLMPFIHYMYKSTPATMKCIVDNPHNFMRYVSLQAMLLFAFDASSLGGSDEEPYLPKWAHNEYNLFFAKQWVRIFDTDWFINIGRGLPGMKFGMFNYIETNPTLALGFIGSVASIASGKQPLGYNIWNKYDTFGEKLGKSILATGENFAPSISLFGRYGQRTIHNLIGFDYDEDSKKGRHQPNGLDELYLRAIGIRKFDTRAQYQKHIRDAEKMLEWAKKNPKLTRAEKEYYQNKYDETMAKLKPTEIR